MKTKIKRLTAFVMLSAASLTILFALPNTQPNLNAQTAPQVTVPGMVATSSGNGGMHTRADTVLPSARYGSHIDLNQASVTLDQLDIHSVTLTAPNQIGVNRSVTVSPTTRAQKFVNPDGSQMIVLIIKSIGASGIGVHFRNFALAAGEQVYVYGPAADSIVFGPFTSKGPWGSGEFWSGTVDGDTVVIEFYKRSDENGQGFEIFEVSHIFPELDLRLRSGQPDVLNCEVDASCYSDTQKNAVARITFNNNGPSVCTGTLLSDVAQDQIPYFLTANHCVNTQAAAQTVEVYWFYQTTSCNSGVLRNWVHTGPGANLLATDSSGNDFSLLRLLNDAPAGAVFSSWTSAAQSTGTGVFGLHHPDGYVPPTIDSYLRRSSGTITSTNVNEDCIGGVHLVNGYRSGWTSGTTEPGSSGSGLWNSNGYLVGLLSCGTGTCSSPHSDYSKFANFYSQVEPYIAGPPECAWTPTSTTNAPSGRGYHTAVWTGSEMIVWGGAGNSGILNTGGRYDPGTDGWTATNAINAPSAREFPTAVWTGSEMIVWGGYNGSYFLNDAGRYNASTNSWTFTTFFNVPTARSGHTAVWTGSEMIVWGGNDATSYFNTGGRYNPSTNTWTVISTTNAPSPRSGHKAVWTGSEMIVWGGTGYSGYFYNTGGRYNPSTDSWTPTSIAQAPAARTAHSAVWTGSEMIVWGGYNNITGNLNTGGRYNPSFDSWTATSTTGAPAARNQHTAVWTGSEMIVWGGYPGYLNTGGKYNPGTDSWTATSTAPAPGGRDFHTAVWTGSQMIIWGGSDGTNYLNTGGKYCAAASSPTPPPTPTPTPAVTTNPATNVASFSAMLHGSVNPDGSTTTVYFQYGPTTNYGLTTAMQTRTGNTVRPISANISGLTASTTYHFRIVAHNSGGTSYGGDTTFTTLTATGPPVVTTNLATNRTTSSATLNGSLDPHGLSTTVSFRWGTTTSYGHTTVMQSQTGNTYRNIAANISGLATHTTYHFRIVATNSAGTRFGSDRTFRTL